MTRYRCRVCGQRLAYLRRTFIFRHLIPSDHAPAPVAERGPDVKAWDRHLARLEHDS